MHAVSPVASWYVPELHGVHAASPPDAATVPAAHATCATLPVGAKEPGSVVVHSLANERLVALEYDPSVHGSAAAAPVGQYEPDWQALHAVSPLPSWNAPPSHCVHSDWLCRSVYVPGAHSM